MSKELPPGFLDRLIAIGRTEAFEELDALLRDYPQARYWGILPGWLALRVLNDYLKLYLRIREAVKTELPHVRAATAWASRLR
jgi:hypothetical protein